MNPKVAVDDANLVNVYIAKMRCLWEASDQVFEGQADDSGEDPWRSTIALRGSEMGFRFIHAADIHLDSPLRGLSAYENAPVEQLRNATREALKELVNKAIEDRVSSSD